MSHEASEPPDAQVEPVRRWSWAWLVPLLVACALAAAAWQASQERPVRVVVRFEDGSGLRPGDPVNCRGVQIGEVAAVGLAPGSRWVIVRLDLARDAAGVAVEGTQMWVVRPEVSLRGVSGLDALFGPRSITLEPGPADAPRRTVFDGLDGAPPLPMPSDGSLVLTLRGSRRWSLGPGSPVTYRDVEVGRVVGAGLADDASGVDVTVTIDADYAALVRANSRFYNLSGITADWGIFRGLDVRTDSLESVVAGGIGFATPEKPGDRVGNGHLFDLADTPEDGWLKWSPRIPLRSP